MALHSAGAFFFCNYGVLVITLLSLYTRNIQTDTGKSWCTLFFTERLSEICTIMVFQVEDHVLLFAQHSCVLSILVSFCNVILVHSLKKREINSRKILEYPLILSPMMSWDTPWILPQWTNQVVSWQRSRQI